MLHKSNTSWSPARRTTVSAGWLLFGLLLMAPLLAGPVGAQGGASSSDGCPATAELVAAANAVVVGGVVEVRRSPAEATFGDVLVIEILSIDKGGAQNPLAVTFAKDEPLPDLAPELELNVMVTYDIETGRASSSIACGRTTRVDGEQLVLAEINENGDLAETAGETAQEALTVLGVAGIGVIGLTLLWRLFREVRPHVA